MNCVIDYVHMTARLQVKLWLGNSVMADNEEDRERYAPATVQIKQLQYLVIEPPRNERSPEHGQSSIDGYIAAERPGSAAVTLPPTATEHFQYSFYVFDWEASVHFAARSAALSFDDPSDAVYVSELMRRLAGPTSLM